MWELLALTTGKELGQFALTQILAFTQPLLESYVQDFFKGCLDSGIARLKTTQLKAPMAAAIGFFIQRFVKELQFNDIPDSSIQHHYQGALKTFVRDKAVGAILGQAFETGCKKIDFAQLEMIWQQKQLGQGWQFPEDFDWRGVAKEYLVEVKGIVKADDELRALLQTDLLQEIAQNTTQLSPGFDVAKYQDSLQYSYGHLKLYTLDSTDRVDAIKLWSLFVEQTVREALPPMRYELPLDLKRKLLAEGQLEEDLSAEALEHYRRDYFQQPTRKVLDAVADCQRAVILGDPGSGKSTLLQYLALDWVEGKTSALPLLIELREYALAQSANFLDFLHCGRGADWQFDQQQLHQHLLEQPTLVMFDGLDEVFHRPTQAAVIDEIIRFAQQYPQAQILVTSRIVGYTPERFQHAEFKQFTIQPLDESEIHTFIDRWYDLAMGSAGDKVRLKQRLKDAIANSKAIQNLADNPLLLTMMAILNRRQELPRDRADLYDQASRVLLYHWDVDHKNLQLPLDAIGRREKQEMLRAIAYEMQAGEEGLKGNLISAERLTRLLTDYLREQGFSEPREKANRLIEQLRDRNFILCYRGADTYGFVHRTFLEYFCAVEIVHRFEKQQTLTFEQLRDEVFGEHWQDETWNEVLRLICGMIDTKFSGKLIEFLTDQVVKKDQFIDSTEDFKKLRIEGFSNLLLAADCLFDIDNTGNISDARMKLLRGLKHEIESPEVRLSFLAALEIFNRILMNFTEALGWVKRQTIEHGKENIVSRSAIKSAAVNAIVRHNKTSENLDWLKRMITNQDYALRRAATWAIPEYYERDREVLDLLIKRLEEDESRPVRCAAILNISRYYPIDPEIFELFLNVIQEDSFIREFRWQDNPRQLALETLINNHSDDPKVSQILKERAANDPDEQLREWAQEQLKLQTEKSKREGQS